MEGIQINLISREKLRSMDSDEKVDFILKEVLDGRVLVLEEGLSAVEESELIKRTMASIDHETFIGIEIQGYYTAEDVRRSLFTRIFRRKTPARMTVIGPAAYLRTIYKDGSVIKALILTEKPYLSGDGHSHPPSEEVLKTSLAGPLSE